MSTYELDDDLVREAMTNSPKSHAARDLVLSALKRQLPPRVPTKVGAVIQDHGTAVYVRVTEDTPHENEWWNTSEGQWCATEALPRIGKVLSEGVDLP